MRRSFTLLLSFLLLSITAVFGQNTGEDPSSQSCFNCSGANTIFSGNLGLGTSSPSQKIHVYGNILLENTSTNSGQLLFSRINGLSDDTWNIYSNTTGFIFSHSESSGVVIPKPTTVLFLGNSDKVGIGIGTITCSRQHYV